MKEIIVGEDPTACRCERFSLFALILIVTLACTYGLIRLADVDVADEDQERHQAESYP